MLLPMELLPSTCSRLTSARFPQTIKNEPGGKDAKFYQSTGFAVRTHGYCVYTVCIDYTKQTDYRITNSNFSFLATAIHTRTYRISSDLRSQAGVGTVSTGVGDHLGILCAVVFV